MKDSKKLISAYDRFVPHKLLQLLQKKDITEIKLGDQVEKRITILFTDIRDFTTLSENLTPQESFNFINSYLSQMDPLIAVNNGVIDKYIGDAIMAIFPEKSDDAYNCAINMLKQLRLYNEGRSRAGYHPIGIGIGLNTGLAMIGTVGSFNRMDATVISDEVNLCSRIESLTKNYKTELLISESTYNDLSIKNKKYTRFIDRVLVKGKFKPQTIYEVFEMDEKPVREHKYKSKGLFEEALANYHYGNVALSKKLLKKYLSDNVNDAPAKLYYKKCVDYSISGPDDSLIDFSDRISWCDRFLLGHELIDKQHQELVDESLALIEAVEQEMSADLIEKNALGISEKAKIHFDTEEAIMENAEYPLLEFHKRQHISFLKSFPHLADNISDKSTSKTFKMFKIQIFLIDWLVNHTLKDDQNFGKYLGYFDG